MLIWMTTWNIRKYKHNDNNHKCNDKLNNFTKNSYHTNVPKPHNRMDTQKWGNKWSIEKQKIWLFKITRKNKKSIQSNTQIQALCHVSVVCCHHILVLMQNWLYLGLKCYPSFCFSLTKQTLFSGNRHFSAVMKWSSDVSDWWAGIQIWSKSQSTGKPLRLSPCSAWVG